MPRKVTAYGCSFGCGAKVKMSYSAMSRHETTCASNPDRRACRTCVHQRNWDDGWACDLDLVPDGKLLVVSCPSWAEHADGCEVTRG